MRTTITLDPDVEALVKKLMKQRRLSFKEAVNAALRDALAPGAAQGQYSFEPVHLGEPKVPVEQALQLAAALEDEAIVRKMSVGK